MREDKKPRADEVFVDWEENLPGKTNGRAHDDNTWLVHFKNVFSAIWPLFMYIGIVLLLLLYLWSR